MKTRVGDTAELEPAAMEETRRNPSRFDDTKLFGRDSWWEFCRRDRSATIGFLACGALSGAIIGLPLFLLNLAGGA